MSHRMNSIAIALLVAITFALTNGQGLPNYGIQNTGNSAQGQFGQGVQGQFGQGVQGQFGQGVQGQFGQGVQGQFGQGVQGQFGQGQFGQGQFGQRFGGFRSMGQPGGMRQQGGMGAFGTMALLGMAGDINMRMLPFLGGMSGMGMGGIMSNPFFLMSMLN